MILKLILFVYIRYILTLGVSLPKMIEVTAAIIEKDDKFLIARRAKGKHLAGYWEFPGGKI